jgi:DNA-binding GntR family transcriptional regulator
MGDRSDLLINTGRGTQPLAMAVTGRHDDHDHDHDQIIAALRDHDARRARTVLEGHIIGTVDIITGRDRDRNR